MSQSLCLLTILVVLLHNVKLSWNQIFVSCLSLCCLWSCEASGDLNIRDHLRTHTCTLLLYPWLGASIGQCHNITMVILLMALLIHSIKHVKCAWKITIMMLTKGKPASSNIYSRYMYLFQIFISVLLPQFPYPRSSRKTKIYIFYQSFMQDYSVASHADWKRRGWFSIFCHLWVNWRPEEAHSVV